MVMKMLELAHESKNGVTNDGNENEEVNEHDVGEKTSGCSRDR